MTQTTAGGDAPPLSRPLTLADVPPEGLDVRIEATEAERAALAELNGLPAVLSLTADVRARRWRRDGLQIDGELRARVRRACVVTLEEFDANIVELIDMRFTPPVEAARRSRRRDEADEAAVHDRDPLGDDLPDALIGGAVDLGAIASEFLTLALDPYPRKPDAEFVEPAPERDEEAVVSPFAKLRPGEK